MKCKFRCLPWKIMRVLIVEDEKPAARRLERLIQALWLETEIFEVTDSIEDAVAFF